MKVDIYNTDKKYSIIYDGPLRKNLDLRLCMAAAFVNANRENDEENPFQDRYWKYIEATVWD